jgi:flagellar hook-associated protein 2
MATITASGIGSNLDINSIVSQLMAIERQPLTALDRKEASYLAELSAYGSVKGALSTFQTTIASLASTSKFGGRKASLADTTVATVTAGEKAAAGTYSLEVQTLAQAQKLKSGVFAATTDTVGSGTLTIQFGTYSGGAFTANAERASTTISIPAASNSLAGVRDAINAANAGISASIVNDGTGNRLVISSNYAGTANALKITVDDDDGNDTNASGLSQLAYDASSGGTANLTQTAAAQNAVAIIDGITITKASNVITDAIEGVTLTLAKSNTGTPTTLTVAKDTTATKSAVESFVKAYNDLNENLRDVSAYDAETKQAAVLQGDATVRTIQSQLRTVLNAQIDPAPAGLATLPDIGVTFQKDGTLKLDSAKLDKVLADPTKDVATLFAAVAKPSDSLVSFDSATAAAKAGSYALSISQLATRGYAVGSGAAALTITADVNDTLTFTVDGTAGTAKLGAGTYTASALAAEIQSKVNGALTAAGKSVTVTQSAGVLTVTSNAYGSASSISLSGGNGLTALFGTPSPTAGVDVAGSLGGTTGTASGQTLTAQGLKLKVIGGATGSRGTVSFARGFADQLDTLATALLATNGTLDGRTKGINASIQDIADQRAVLERRLEAVEARYRAQFTALDVMLASMNQTSAFLTQQLANLPKIEGATK